MAILVADPLPFNPEKIGYVCYTCSSDKKVAKLVDSAKKFSRGKSFIQLFDNKKEVTGRILQAYLNSALRFQDKVMRSRGLDKEMILLVSGESNITKAIEKNGIKDKKDFVLFSNDRKAAHQFMNSNKIKVRRNWKLKFS